MRIPRILVALIISSFCLVRAQPARSEEAAAKETIKAPDFTAADGWLNTDKSISIKDLKGQVVLLDFWTYCCINCMHVFPDLKYIEDKYKDQPVVVIGIHSGKFDEEKDEDHIRQAVLRHNITHPVAVDSEMKIWEAYGVNGWPTLVLIAPDGSIVGAISGEGNRDIVDRAIQKVLVKYKDGLGKHMDFRSERSRFKSGLLEFPGKILADAAGKRLFISDTNHHRILVTDLEGSVKQTIGSGTIGMKDGSFADATFHQPQGLALSADGRTLYVADTENHAIRSVDLESKTVTTLAGTGEQFRGFTPGGRAKQSALSSPWDLALVGSKLYIAMAGTHQIWLLDLEKHEISVFAGTRREAAVDGTNVQASFAQPSGLASDGTSLFVADSEASSIRQVALKQEGSTVTLAGSGKLFGFGLKDGQGKDALFQHPLGVALSGETLYVADTFNSAIRAINIKTGDVSTWLAPEKSASAGSAPPPQSLYEPGGLSIAGNTMYVADTNHHRIVAIDMKTKAARVIVGGEK